MVRRPAPALLALVLAALAPGLPSPAARATGSALPAAVVQVSSLLGGSSGDRVQAVAVDAGGDLLLAGVTSSADFPVRGALQESLAGGADAFVARVSADGRTLLWATFLGGAGDDRATSLAVAPDGEIWVGGSTDSTDFPLKDPIQADSGGDETGFVARIAADGSALRTSTFLGGSGADRVAALAVGDGGSLWVAGTTDSTDFPVTWDAAAGAPVGGLDGFVARLSPDGLSLSYATWLGGTGDDEILAASMDGFGSLLVAGRTLSDDFPALFALQEHHGGGHDAFVASIDGATGSLRFSTCLGGSEDDEARAIASRGTGVFALAGETTSPDFPLLNPLQGEPAGGADAFLAVVTIDGTNMPFATLLGGSGDEAASAVAVGRNGSLLVAGATDSADLPLRAAGQPSPAGGADGFLLRIDGSWSSLAQGTLLGGSGDDGILALAEDASGAPVVAGATASDDFPLLLPFQGARAGGEEGFLARPLSAPPTPADFRVLAVTHLAASLSWTDPTGGRATFELQRQVGTGAWKPLALPAPDALAFLDGDVLPVTGYGYRLRLLLDGLPSPWSATLRITTPQEPIPAAPGGLAVELLPDGTASLLWEDRSDNETLFELHRSEDGGPFAFLRSLPAGATTALDDALAPDRAYAWEVRAIGVSGASPFSAAAAAATAGNLGVTLESGKRRDSAKFGRDTLQLRVLLEGAPGAAALDPVEGGLRVALGTGNGTALVSLAPRAEGWRSRKGVFTWKSPRGSAGKFTLVLDGRTGALTLRGSRLELPAAAAGTLRLSVRCGGEAGSSYDGWVEGRKGTLQSAGAAE